MDDVTHLVIVVTVGMRLGQQHNPGVAVGIVQRDDPLRGAKRKIALEAPVSGVSARTVRISRRIIRPTVRLRIQPISTALRIASPRRWKRHVANE